MSSHLMLLTKFCYVSSLSYKSSAWGDAMRKDVGNSTLNQEHRAMGRQGSRKIRITFSMVPHAGCVKRLTIELVEGREVEKVVTTVTKNGVVTRYSGKFHEYQLTDEEKEFHR
ncbi:hypothetical protein Tco_0451942 [Tanacetum coccineum]